MPARAAILALAWLLAGCTAPAPQADAARAPGAAQASDAAPAPAAAQGRDAARPARRMPPLGGPLPPIRVEDAGCDVDADCAVRVAANGCGSCVPRAALGGTPPAGASAASCGPQQAEGCRCVDHRCESKPRMVDSPVQQAADEDAP